MIPAFLITTAASLFGPPSPFELHATPIEVVEGGPVVVEVKVIHRGTATVRHLTGGVVALTPTITAGVPKDWFGGTARKQIFFHFAGDPFEADIKPGETIAARTIYLHQEYPSLIPGKATSFPVTWRERVWRVDNSQPHNETIITRLVTIRPEPFGPLVIERMEKRFRELNEIDRKNAEYHVKENDLVRRLVDTSHAEFIPLAYEMLCGPCDLANRAILENFILSFPSHVAKFDAWRMERALSQNYAWGPLLSEWSNRERTPAVAATAVREAVFHLDDERLNWVARRHKPRPVAEPIVEQLCKVKSVWLRACVYLSFPDRMPSKWVETLAAELRDEVTPLPKDALTRSLADLGSRDYRTREAAELFLSSRAERSAEFLRAALMEELSVEAQRRVEKILDRTKEPPDPHQVLCLSLLSQRQIGDPERTLLAILKEGDPQCRAVKAARAMHIKMKGIDVERRQ